VIWFSLFIDGMCMDVVNVLSRLLKNEDETPFIIILLFVFALPSSTRFSSTRKLPRTTSTSTLTFPQRRAAFTVDFWLSNPLARVYDFRFLTHITIVHPTAATLRART
jgi:hypothetical protein